MVTTETMKIGRGSNKITIKRIDLYNEMFSNDIDRIKQFIAASDYPDKIDANVILEFNKHAVTLSEQEYRYYVSHQQSEDKIMMYFYENIFKNNKKIDKTLNKLIDQIERCSEDELMYLFRWEGSHHAHYYAMKKIYGRTV